MASDLLQHISHNRFIIAFQNFCTYLRSNSAALNSFLFWSHLTKPHIKAGLVVWCEFIMMQCFIYSIILFGSISEGLYTSTVASWLGGSEKDKLRYYYFLFPSTQVGQLDNLKLIAQCSGKRLHVTRANTSNCLFYTWQGLWRSLFSVMFILWLRYLYLINKTGSFNGDSC